MGTAGGHIESKFKILLVDDEEAIREAYGGMLRKKGYTVDLVESGEEAIDALKNSEYDLLLLDIKLKGIDGIETLGRVRQMKNDVKTVMISGCLTDSLREQSYRLGASNCIPKPFSIETLATNIRQVLS